jgi:hypothetical protein
MRRRTLLVVLVGLAVVLVGDRRPSGCQPVGPC